MTRRPLPKMPENIAIEVKEWDGEFSDPLGVDKLYSGRHPHEQTHRTYVEAEPLNYYINGKQAYRVKPYKGEDR